MTELRKRNFRNRYFMASETTRSIAKKGFLTALEIGGKLLQLITID